MKEIIPKSVTSTITPDGVMHLTIQLTEAQMALVNRGNVGGFSIEEPRPVYERIEWKPGEGFVIEVPEDRGTLAEQP